MRLERIHEYVMTTVVLVVGLFLAMLCGKLSGAGQLNLLALGLIGIVFLVLCLTFRAKIWVAIPLTWHLVGQIPILPIPAAARDLVVISLSGMYIAFIALRLVRIKPVFDALDFWLLINLLYIGSTFIRNPIGSLAMGSERVGGRSYMTVFTAVLAYWVMSRAWCRAKGAKLLPGVTTLMICVDGGIQILCQKYLWLSAVLGQVYSSFAVDTTLRSADLTGRFDEHDARQVALVGPGLAIEQGLMAYFRPLSLLNPFLIWRFIVAIGGIVMIFYSGFRSVFMQVMLGFLLSSYIRRGWFDVLRICGIIVPVLLILGLMQGTIVDLPMPAQRALSFLPGNWSAVAKQDAEGSTRWRVEMWIDALTTEKYIDNKWFGDGFGTSVDRMQRVMLIQSLPSLTTEEAQESAAIVGNFHSGPVSGIRCVGYVGLLLFYCLLFQSAWHAMNLMRQSKETPFQALALFIGIPVVVRPFFFTLIFGAYTDDLPNVIFAIGLMKMLSNSIAISQQSTMVAKPKPEVRRLALAPVGRIESHV